MTFCNITIFDRVLSKGRVDLNPSPSDPPRNPGDDASGNTEVPLPSKGIKWVKEAAQLPSGQYEAVHASDNELLSRLAQGRGRETALPELFSRHGDRALRLAVRILGDWQVAEESVQDAFLRLAEKASLWRGEAGFNTFFTKILVNVCRNRRRLGHDALAKGKIVGSPSQMLSGMAASARITEVAKHLQEEETKQSVRAAIEKLPEKYREVLILREFEGFSYKEIADILEATLDEVRIWIFRGRSRLRKIMEEETPNDD